MTSKAKVEAFEITSVQIHGRLIHIEDRIAGVEAILSHVNRGEIEDLVKAAVGNSEHRKVILRECETPKTINQLQIKLGLKSPQNVNYHLTPLRDHGLLRHAKTTNPITYEWSPLVTRLSNAAREKILK
jgi:DNA-binding transcriptional ArsR family regulator